MNNILKVFKYQIRDFKKPVIIFYLIVLLLSVSTVFTISGNTEEVSFGGFEIATAIFLFVLGLNCFKSNFKFMLANNVSRKRFYFGNIIALVLVAAFMALIDTILNSVLGFNYNYKSIVFQIYRINSFFAEIIWSFGLNALLVCSGWFITMLYYRCSKVMKIIVSIAPIPITILLRYIDSLSDGSVSRAAADFLYKALGFTNNNPYIGASSFLVGAAVITAIGFLFIRNAVAKD